MSRIGLASLLALTVPLPLLFGVCCALPRVSTPAKEARSGSPEFAKACAEAEAAHKPLFVVFRCER